MKANVTLLIGVFSALIFFSTSISHQHGAATVATPAPATAPATAPAASPSTTPSPPAAASATPDKPAIKLCSVNKLSTVPAASQHTYSVKNIQASKYQNADFDVTWKEVKVKKHRFFNWIGRKANFPKAFSKMKCQIAQKKVFGKVCNYNDNQVDQFYKNAFGQDLVFRCVVPQDSFILNTRFVLQLSDFATSAGGRWSVFGGVYQYTSQEDANKQIQAIAKQINERIKSSKLNTFDINQNLNIIPDFVKGTLSWIYTSNINAPYVKSTQKSKQYDLSDVGFAKILPPGTEFIIGSIYNGTTSVKQICDNYRFDDVKDDCGFKL